MWLGGYKFSQVARKFPEPFTPSKMLRFKPIHKGSDPNDIRIAQAELCRHGIDVKIDSEYGKETAFGMCELLWKLENGYKIYSMFERNRNGEEKNHSRDDNQKLQYKREGRKPEL